MSDYNIYLAMGLAALGGILNVFATALLAYPEHKKNNGKEWSKKAQWAVLVGNILFQFANSGVNVIASWFGPVSVVLPTIVSAQMLFNMIMFGALLQIERFPKEVRVATYVVVLATILLPIVGPSEAGDQKVLQLLSQPGSATWMLTLIVCMIASTTGLIVVTCRARRGEMEKKNKWSFLLNMTAQASAGVLGVTLSKLFVLVQGWYLAAAVLLWGLTGLVQTFAIVLQATTVTQGIFVPSLVVANILINAITGIIVWGDLAVIQSGLGYACILLLMVFGCYLLCDLDALSRFNKKDIEESGNEDQTEKEDFRDVESPVIKNVVNDEDGDNRADDASLDDTTSMTSTTSSLESV